MKDPENDTRMKHNNLERKLEVIKDCVRFMKQDGYPTAQAHSVTCDDKTAIVLPTVYRRDAVQRRTAGFHGRK